MARTMWLADHSITEDENADSPNFALIQKAFTEAHQQYIETARRLESNDTEINGIDLFADSPLWTYGVKLVEQVFA